MDRQFVVADIRSALLKRELPTITMWERIEGRPRALNFDRALRAEVRDALWMISKQWQMAEFRADDAGSPAFAKVHLAVSRLTKFQAAHGAVEQLDDAQPLEARVERRTIPFVLDGRNMSLDIRLLMGRYWLRLVSGIGNYRQAFAQEYSIGLPDPTRPDDADVCAHPEAWQMVAAVAGRAVDGGSLYAYLKADAAHHAYDGITGVLEAHKPDIDDRARDFIRWFEQTFSQPPAGDGDAWIGDRLEYQFACAAPAQDQDIVLSAEEYYHGRLDWYNLDLAGSGRALPDPGNQPLNPRYDDVRTMMPVQVTYDGMPNTRWWAFEDHRVNFGEVKPTTTDIGKLLFLEFGLVYANDWFLVPFTVPAGSVARVGGVAVTTVFGERFWIEAAGAGAENDWQRWSMFTLSAAESDAQHADTLLLLPTAPKVQDGAPLEEVMLVRDEMANMVWGVERTIGLPTGDSKSGFEAATESSAYYRRFVEARLAQGAVDPAPDYAAPVRFRVMTTVPENWIPFVPVHVPGDNREIQLQRAAMPRIIEGNPDPPSKVRPRTFLLREGLDARPAFPYFLHEEEVPRAGAIVRRRFHRARWQGGKVVVWLGVTKQIGRGGGSSGLSFDQLLSEPRS